MAALDQRRGDRAAAAPPAGRARRVARCRRPAAASPSCSGRIVVAVPGQDLLLRSTCWRRRSRPHARTDGTTAARRIATRLTGSPARLPAAAARRACPARARSSRRSSKDRRNRCAVGGEMVMKKRSCEARRKLGMLNDGWFSIGKPAQEGEVEEHHDRRREGGEGDARHHEGRPANQRPAADVEHVADGGGVDAHAHHQREAEHRRRRPP